MNIDWAALGQVFGVSLAVTVAIVGLFTLGIVGTSRPGRGAGSVAVARTVGGYVCYALCAAAVAFGIHLIAF
ncbi:hypothetical protein ABZ611_00765 [Streptomyces sp. NPDC007861]|uniref:hypothetical protein n=1 Tax=Streptomyces sp. NPDC007861 TaxID=3154893 RepID=UPI0033CFF6E6